MIVTVLNTLRSIAVTMLLRLIVTPVDEGVTNFEPLPISKSLSFFNEILSVVLFVMAFLNVKMTEEISLVVPIFNPTNVLVDESETFKV